MWSLYPQFDRIVRFQCRNTCASHTTDLIQTLNWITADDERRETYINSICAVETVSCRRRKSQDWIRSGFWTSRKPLVIWFKIGSRVQCSGSRANGFGISIWLNLRRCIGGKDVDAFRAWYNLVKGHIAIKIIQRLIYPNQTSFSSSLTSTFPAAAAAAQKKIWYTYRKVVKWSPEFIMIGYH